MQKVYVTHNEAYVKLLTLVSMKIINKCISSGYIFWWKKALTPK